MEKFTNLRVFSLHDITDDWKIALFDAELTPLEDEGIKQFSSLLKTRLTSVEFPTGDSTCKISSDIEFEICDNTLKLLDVFPGQGENTHDEVAVCSEICMQLAAELDVNCLMTITQYALNLGNEIVIWSNSAYINHQTSYSEMYLYEVYDEESDDYIFVREIDGEEEVDNDTKAEWLTDLMWDGFESSPYGENDEEKSEMLSFLFESFFE